MSLTSSLAIVLSSPLLCQQLYLLALLIPSMKRDYQAFLDLGEGGLPYNPFGWVIARLLGLLGRETKSIDIYDKHPEKRAWLSNPLPQRDGPRPTIGRHVAPHRQIDQHPLESVKLSARALIDIIHALHPSTTVLAPSVHEGRCEALFVHPEVPCPVAEKAITDHRGREIGHVHPLIDCSLHALIAPRDCKEVITKGWGERHPLSGVFGDKDVQVNFLFIYAPRTEKELEVVTRILDAAVGYMTNDESIGH